MMTAALLCFCSMWVPQHSTKLPRHEAGTPPPARLLPSCHDRRCPPSASAPGLLPNLHGAPPPRPASHSAFIFPGPPRWARCHGSPPPALTTGAPPPRPLHSARLLLNCPGRPPPGRGRSCPTAMAGAPPPGPASRPAALTNTPPPGPPPAAVRPLLPTSARQGRACQQHRRRRLGLSPARERLQPSLCHRSA